MSTPTEQRLIRELSCRLRKEQGQFKPQRRDQSQEVVKPKFSGGILRGNQVQRDVK